MIQITELEARLARYQATPAHFDAQTAKTRIARLEEDLVEARAWHLVTVSKAESTPEYKALERYQELCEDIESRRLHRHRDADATAEHEMKQFNAKDFYVKSKNE